MTADLEPLLSTKQAAALMGISARKLADMCAARLIDHEVPSYDRYGRPTAYRPRPSDIEKWRNQHRVKAAKK